MDTKCMECNTKSAASNSYVATVMRQLCGGVVYSWVHSKIYQDGQEMPWMRTLKYVQRKTAHSIQFNPTEGDKIKY